MEACIGTACVLRSENNLQESVPTLLFGVLGSNSGGQTWWQGLTKPSYQTLYVVIYSDEMEIPKLPKQDFYFWCVCISVYTYICVQVHVYAFRKRGDVRCPPLSCFTFIPLWQISLWIWSSLFFSRLHLPTPPALGLQVCAVMTSFLWESNSGPCSCRELLLTHWAIFLAQDLKARNNFA